MNYYSDKTTVKRVSHQQINLNQLKHLDEQLEILRKELNTLDLIQAITESTSQLCFSTDDETEEYIIDRQINEEFYLQIANDLTNAANHLNKEIV